jgi:hypothetical protein
MSDHGTVTFSDLPDMGLSEICQATPELRFVREKDVSLTLEQAHIVTSGGMTKLKWRPVPITDRAALCEEGAK